MLVSTYLPLISVGFDVLLVYNPTVFITLLAFHGYCLAASLPNMDFLARYNPSILYRSPRGPCPRAPSDRDLFLFARSTKALPADEIRMGHVAMRQASRLNFAVPLTVMSFQPVDRPGATPAGAREDCMDAA